MRRREAAPFRPRSTEVDPTTNDDAPAASAGPDTDASTREETEPPGDDPLGTVDLRPDLDAETFQRVRAAYWRARRAG